MSACWHVSSSWAGQPVLAAPPCTATQRDHFGDLYCLRASRAHPARCALYLGSLHRTERDLSTCLRTCPEGTLWSRSHMCRHATLADCAWDPDSKGAGLPCTATAGAHDSLHTATPQQRQDAQISLRPPGWSEGLAWAWAWGLDIVCLQGSCLITEIPTVQAQVSCSCCARKATSTECAKSLGTAHVHQLPPLKLATGSRARLM